MTSELFPPGLPHIPSPHFPSTSHYRLSSLASPSFFLPFPLFSSLHPPLCLRASEVDINECCDRLQQVISFLTPLAGDSSPRSSGWRDGGTARGKRRDRESLPFSYFFFFLLFFFFCQPAAFLYFFFNPFSPSFLIVGFLSSFFLFAVLCALLFSPSSKQKHLLSWRETRRVSRWSHWCLLLNPHTL